MLFRGRGNFDFAEFHALKAVALIIIWLMISFDMATPIYYIGNWLSKFDES
jgi:hypothetical protein